MNDLLLDSSPTRGPEDHEIRDQIISAAANHFSQSGYNKTTVAELARSIGFSKAYVYKFFESKQAIGEVICGQCLARLIDEIATPVKHAKHPTEKMRQLFMGAARASTRLWFYDFKLYEIAACAAYENWPPVARYEQQIQALVETVVRAGREQGDFERKTPLDEVTRAISRALRPYVHPLMLEHNLDNIDETPRELANLILRSLAP